MSNPYPNNRRPQGRRPAPTPEARRKATMAAREKRRKEKQRIRIATIAGLVLIVAIIAVVILSCSRGKAPAGSSSAGSNIAAPDAPTKTPDKKEEEDNIPTEYVAATAWHDDIEVTDEYPTQGWDSSYSIHVNTALNAVTVYDANGNAVRVLTCSTGRRDGHETPEGTFYLGEWIIDWCYMADGSYGLHAYRIIDNINNDIMFHSVPYYSSWRGDLESEQYNKLGDYASMGCIRMCVADCRWLGQLCATGTEVVVYNDPNEVLPMEKPTPIRIPLDIPEVSGWDPTDPISENPWHNYSIDLQVPNRVDLAKNADLSDDPVLAAASASDSYGNNVSHYMWTSGSINTAEEGIYTVRVGCDVGPAHAYKDVYVVVK